MLLRILQSEVFLPHLKARHNINQYIPYRNIRDTGYKHGTKIKKALN